MVHLVVHLVVKKYDRPSAGATGGRERELRTVIDSVALSAALVRVLLSLFSYERLGE